MRAGLLESRDTISSLLMSPLLLVLPALLFANAAHVPSPPKPARLGLCAACHGENGVASEAGIPHLAAQNRDYLATALRQYRGSERNVPAMRAAAGVLSDADIDALADWYSAQPSRAAGAAP
jgi:cytochrome c553